MAAVCFRIGINNYLDPAVLANRFASSEKAGFPISNAYPESPRRSKLWKSDGLWLITAANNVLEFAETLGDLTATIAVDTYTSTASLATAIKTALDAAGLSTYTVTHDASTFYKFKISSNGAGGIFTIKHTDAGSTLSSVLGFSTVVDDSGLLTYLADDIKISSDGEHVTNDLAIATNPKEFYVINERNKPMPLSPGGTYKLLGNFTDNFSSGANIEFESTITYDPEVLSLVSDNGLHTEGLRYWRFLMEDDNSNGSVSIGAIFLGDFWDPSRGRAQFPVKSNLISFGRNSRSEGGQTFADVKEHSQGWDVEWKALQLEDIEDLEQFWEQVRDSKPFFVSMDSDEVWSSNRNKRIVFVKFAKEPTWSLISPNNFTASFQLEEQL